MQGTVQKLSLPHTLTHKWHITVIWPHTLPYKLHITVIWPHVLYAVDYRKLRSCHRHNLTLQWRGYKPHLTNYTIQTTKATASRLHRRYLQGMSGTVLGPRTVFDHKQLYRRFVLLMQQNEPYLIEINPLKALELWKANPDLSEISQLRQLTKTVSEAVCSTIAAIQWNRLHQPGMHRDKMAEHHPHPHWRDVAIIQRASCHPGRHVRPSHLRWRSSMGQLDNAALDESPKSLGAWLGVSITPSFAKYTQQCYIMP